MCSWLSEGLLHRGAGFTRAPHTFLWLSVAVKANTTFPTALTANKAESLFQGSRSRPAGPHLECAIAFYGFGPSDGSAGR